MKRLVLVTILFPMIAACAPQPAPPLVAAASPPGLGPSKNMSLNYDGTYAADAASKNPAAIAPRLTHLRGRAFISHLPVQPTR